MKNYCLIILALTGLSACTSPDKTESAQKPVIKATPDSLLIIQGNSIGKIKLGEDMQSLSKLFGKPGQSDAAMGGASYTWFADNDSSGNRTSVYGRRNFGSPDENILHIKKIMVTSVEYITDQGVKVGTTQDSLKILYHLSDSSRYVVKSKAVNAFADIAKGVAFEIDPVTRKCTAISVFAPGDTAAFKINLY
jgi:hypothetical protein